MANSFSTMPTKKPPQTAKPPLLTSGQTQANKLGSATGKPKIGNAAYMEARNAKPASNMGRTDTSTAQGNMRKALRQRGAPVSAANMRGRKQPFGGAAGKPSQWAGQNNRVPTGGPRGGSDRFGGNINPPGSGGAGATTMGRVQNHLRTQQGRGTKQPPLSGAVAKPKPAPVTRPPVSAGPKPGIANPKPMPTQRGTPGIAGGAGTQRNAVMPNRAKAQ